MTTLKEHDVKADTIHRDPAFGKPDMSVLISTTVFSALGAFVGHYVGKFGEMNIKLGYRGLSTLLGTVTGGVLFGSVAGYSAMREQVKEKMQEHETPQTQAQYVDHRGSVQLSAHDKSL